MYNDCKIVNQLISGRTKINLLDNYGGLIMIIGKKIIVGAMLTVACLAAPYGPEANLTDGIGLRITRAEAAAPSDEQMEAVYKRACESKNYSEGIRYFSRVLAGNRNPAALLYRGILYLCQKDFSKARTDFLAAVSLAKNDEGKIMGYAGAGMSYFFDSDYHEAKNYFDRFWDLGKKNPNNEVYKSMLSSVTLAAGLTYDNLGDYKNALKCYAANYAKNWENNLYAGDIYRINLKDDQAAYVRYMKAISLNSEAHEAYYGLGCVSVRQEEYSKAVEYFNKAIEIFNAKHNGFRAGRTYEEQRQACKYYTGRAGAYFAKHDYTRCIGDCKFILQSLGGGNNVRELMEAAKEARHERREAKKGFIKGIWDAFYGAASEVPHSKKLDDANEIIGAIMGS